MFHGMHVYTLTYICTFTLCMRGGKGKCKQSVESNLCIYTNLKDMNNNTNVFVV